MIKLNKVEANPDRNLIRPIKVPIIIKIESIAFIEPFMISIDGIKANDIEGSKINLVTGHCFSVFETLKDIEAKILYVQGKTNV